MDIQLQELLDRIKTEGVEAAQAQAAAVIADAERKASDILSEAERKASGVEAAAKDRIAAWDAASRKALEQVSRDSILALRDRVSAFIAAAIRTDATKAYDAKILADVLPGILKGLVGSAGEGFEVLLPPDLAQKLDALLAKRLAEELGKGVEFKPFGGIDAGFRVAAKNGSVQYDFSADAVAEILAGRVNAKLADCVRAASAAGSARP